MTGTDDRSGPGSTGPDPAPGIGRDDDRGVSAVLGGVLLFGILMALLVSLQVTAVPAFNQGVEYDHNQRVHGQMDDLRRSALLSATTGERGTAAIELGTDYPRRPFLFNPSPATGSISTGPTGTVRVENATASGDPGDYWTGADRTFTTRPVTYEPAYHEYDNAPVTRLEGTVLYNDFGGDQVALSGDSLIDGRRVSLLLVDGSLAKGGVGSRSIDVDPTSAPTRTVTVRNRTDPVVVSVPTRLSEGKWNDLLADELVARGGHVTRVDYREGDPYNHLVVALEPGVTYELSLSKVGLGSGIDRPEAEYVTAAEGDGSTVPPARSTRLVAEVRDQYDNPVSGTEVDAAVVEGEGSVRPVDDVTDREGRAVFEYTAPADETTATVEARIAGSPTPREVATFTVDVFDTIRTREFLDMGQEAGIVFVAVTSPTGPNNNKAEIDFENRAGKDREVVAARFVSYYHASPPNPDRLATGVILDDTGPILEMGGLTTTLNESILLPEGETRTITFDFRRDDGTASSSVANDDFVVVTFQFADGETSTYLIQLNSK